MSVVVLPKLGSVWATGFVADVSLSNAGPALSGWTVSFDAAFEITNIWNAQIISHVGSHYVIGAMAYNASLAAGGVASFGFQAAGSAASLANLAYVDPNGPAPPPALPSLGVADVVLAEPASGQVTATFEVSLSAAATGTVTVHYGTVDGTARLGTDYLAASGDLVFAPGETRKTVAVTVLADPAQVGTESFGLHLSAASGATLARADASATLTYSQPSLSVGDISLAEPSGAGAFANFDVTLSAAASRTVTVHWGTVDGTAKSGADYLAASGDLVFAPGQTKQTVQVKVLADPTQAATESFGLHLSAAGGASLARADAVATLVYVPPAPPPPPAGGASLTEKVANEWVGGFVANFSLAAGSSAVHGWTVAFDAPFGLANIWNAQVASHVGNHYVIAPLAYDADVAAGGSIGFGFQATGTSATLTNLVLSTNGGTAPVTPTPPAISIADLTIAEPKSGSADALFVVTLSAASAGTVTVDYNTADGTAVAFDDYTPVHGRLVFAPGQTSQTVHVGIAAGAPSGHNESFVLNLSNAVGATIADAQAVATIVEPATTGTGTGGWLHTAGNQIVAANGAEVQINAINWFGMEGANEVPDGLWTRSYTSMLDQMVSLGFNTIRLPYSDAIFDAGAAARGINTGLNPDLAGLTPLQVLDLIVDYAGKIGLRIILDHHRNDAGAGAPDNGLWYDGKYSEATMIRNWVALADRYGANPTVIGADLQNEPHNATWGDGSATDWQLGAQRIGNAVLEHAPNWLILVEGTGVYNGDSYWWGGNLEGVAAHPVVLDVANRLVYSPHDYPNSVYAQPWFSAANFPDNLDAVFSRHWGYIYQQGIAPVLLGEWGSKLVDPKDIAWAQALESYLHGDIGGSGNGLGPSWAWWSWNPNSGDTGGILKDDWQGVNADKIALLKPLLFGLLPGAAVASHALNLTNSDISASGQAEVLFQNENGTVWYWHVADGSLRTEGGSVTQLGPEWRVLDSGDTSGTGHASFLAQSTNGDFCVFGFDASQSLVFRGVNGNLGADWTELAMTDVNGDGRADVLFRHKTDGAIWAWHMDGATIVDSVNLGTAPAGFAFGAAADVNGDGKADLVWLGQDGALGVSFLDGRSITTTVALRAAEAGLRLLGAADFTGSGKAELLVEHADGSAALLAMSGTIVTSETPLGQIGDLWHVVGLGDYAGHGHADILWQNDAGEIWLWTMENGRVASAGALGSVGPDWHIIGH